MSSQTYYLKYRPSLISELDNEEVAEKLTAYLKPVNLPHAFLLVGYKGTGKTSSARLIAKVVNCENNIFGAGKSLEPCDKCELCKSIAAGNNPDVLEIDAASNTSVEDVRDLRNKVILSPSMSRYKVYIIDEVHMISRSAFNALLKTLEEPPQKTIFVLATTEFEKVPETIASRCTIINFKKADENSVKKSLGRIIHGEKLKIDDDVILEIAKMSGGSFRDAAKLLEEIVSISRGGKIEKEILQKINGGITGGEAVSLLQQLTKKDAKSAVLKIEELKDKGVDLRNFLKGVLETLHQVLLAKLKITNYELRINKIADELSQEQLKIIIENFEKAYSEMKFSDMAELPIEMAIMEILTNTNQYYQILSNTNKNDSRVNQSMQKQADDKDFWNNLINRINTESKQTAAVLRSCKLINQTNDEIQIEAPSKFHYDRLRDSKTISMVETSASQILNKDVKMKTAIKN